MRPAQAALAVASAIAGAALPAGAEPVDEAAARPRVVLVRLEETLPEQAWPEAERRVAAELEAAGLEVLSTPASAVGSEAEALAEIALAASAHDGVAAVRLARAPPGATVLVWLEAGALRRRVTEAELAAPAAVSDVALAVAELLHGRLLELGPGPGAAGTRDEATAWDPVPEADVEAEAEAASDADADSGSEADADSGSEADADALPAPAVTTLHPPRRSLSRVGLRFGPSVIVPIDLEGAMFSSFVGAFVRLLEWLSLDVEAEVALVPQGIEADGREATLGTALFRGFVTFEPFSRGPLRPGLGLGGGLLVAWSEGASDPECESRLVSSAAGYVAALLRFVVPLSASVRLLVAASVGLTPIPIEVYLAGRYAGMLGAPIVDVSLGVEWGLLRFSPFDS